MRGLTDWAPTSRGVTFIFIMIVIETSHGWFAVR